MVWICAPGRGSAGTVPARRGVQRRRLCQSRRMSALRAKGDEEGTPDIAAVANEPTVAGFRFAAAACGMRFVGRDDLGLIVCDRPATWAGVYTTSSAPGAPVVV